MHRTAYTDDQTVVISIKAIEFINAVFLTSLALLLLEVKEPTVLLPAHYQATYLRVIPASHTLLILAVSQMVLMFSEHWLCRKLSSVILTFSALVWGFMAVLRHVDATWLQAIGFTGHMSLIYIVLSILTFCSGTAIQDRVGPCD